MVTKCTCNDRIQTDSTDSKSEQYSQANVTLNSTSNTDIFIAVVPS